MTTILCYNKNMTIFYMLYNKLYVNITNACSCACVFCIRNNSPSVGSADSLWLEYEPDFSEIKQAFDAVSLEGVAEITFCGYGEPMERADLVIQTAEYIKKKCALPVRLNTNGLVKLMNPDFDVKRLVVFDFVSISLNAPDEEAYLRVTNPRFGAGSYRAMLDFALEAKKVTAVGFTAVDVIGEENLQKCEAFAASMEIPLRVRHFVQNNDSYD